MLDLRSYIAVLLALMLAGGCDLIAPEPSKYDIQQINPGVLRADDPPALTITGSGMDQVDWVGFGYSSKRSDRKEITVIEKPHITVINESTIAVLPPALPGIAEREKVWISVGGTTYESDPIAVMYRPPNAFELYGLQALATIGVVTALIVGGLLIRRGFRRMQYRNAVLEAKGRRLALRDKRRAKAVLAEIAAEKKAHQLKLEAEFLPYAKKPAGNSADD